MKSVGDELIDRGHDLVLRERIGNAHGLTIEYSEEGIPIRFADGADTRGTGSAKGV